MTRYRSADLWLQTAVTRFERWTGLSDRQKYLVCSGLWLCYIIGSVPPTGVIAHILLYPRFFLCSPDIYLNVRGLLGRRRTMSADAVGVDDNDHACASVNAACRLPLVVLTACLIVCTAAGVIEVTTQECARWSIALLALASSMYLKDTDVRLLDREAVEHRAATFAITRS